MKGIKKKGIIIVLVSIITITICGVFFALDLKHAITVMALNSIIGGMLQVYLGYLIVRDVIEMYSEDI